MATYCRKLAKPDGALDFTQPATVLAARINGLFPWPACSVDINGVPVKFGLAVAAIGEGVAGTILGVDSEGLLIATGEGVLCVRRLQRPGGRMLAAAEFMRGFPIPVGTMLSSQPMPILVVTAPFRR
jgi:methionyl-tRNA formyltransferase